MTGPLRTIVVNYVSELEESTPKHNKIARALAPAFTEALQCYAKLQENATDKQPSTVETIHAKALLEFLLQFVLIAKPDKNVLFDDLDSINSASLKRIREDAYALAGLRTPTEINRAGFNPELTPSASGNVPFVNAVQKLYFASLSSVEGQSKQSIFRQHQSATLLGQLGWKSAAARCIENILDICRKTAVAAAPPQSLESLSNIGFWREADTQPIVRRIGKELERIAKYCLSLQNKAEKSADTVESAQAQDKFEVLNAFRVDLNALLQAFNQTFNSADGITLATKEAFLQGVAEIKRDYTSMVSQSSELDAENSLFDVFQEGENIAPTATFASRLAQKRGIGRFFPVVAAKSWDLVQSALATCESVRLEPDAAAAPLAVAQHQAPGSSADDAGHTEKLSISSLVAYCSDGAVSINLENDGAIALPPYRVLLIVPAQQNDLMKKLLRARSNQLKHKPDNIEIFEMPDDAEITSSKMSLHDAVITVGDIAMTTPALEISPQEQPLLPALVNFKPSDDITGSSAALSALFDQCCASRIRYDVHQLAIILQEDFDYDTNEHRVGTLLYVMLSHCLELQKKAFSSLEDVSRVATSQRFVRVLHFLGQVTFWATVQFLPNVDSDDDCNAQNKCKFADNIDHCIKTILLADPSASRFAWTQPTDSEELRLAQLLLEMVKTAAANSTVAKERRMLNL